VNAEVLLAGSVGALAVFVLGIVGEWWRNERERRGLLVLLLAEMGHNTEVIQTVSERVGVDGPIEDLVGNANFVTLKVRTWSKVQGRAAALLPGDLMAALDEYYFSAGDFADLVGFAYMVSDSFDRSLRGEFQEMKPDWPVALTRNPYREQLEKLLGAQERTPAKIEEYLARPRWGPLFLKVDRWAQRRGQEIK